MNSDKAREQLTVAAEAVQSATGADWEPMTDLGPIGCSPGLERMKASWKGVATADRDAGYAAVREALEEVGFETRILGRTPRHLQWRLKRSTVSDSTSRTRPKAG